MDWTRHVDSYCERVSSAFWAEPVNALSNLSFLVAAYLVWRMLSRSGHRPAASLVALVVVLATVGAGSFLFHTYATSWAELADVTPIRLFMLLYLACYLHWFWQLRWWLAWLAAVGFIGFSVLVAPVAATLLPNGSGEYLPAFVVLVGAALGLLFSGDPDRRAYWPHLALATGIFTVSLAFRTVDNAVCPGFPLGTHFLWHVLNGALLFVLGYAVTRRWQALTNGR